MNKQNDWMEKLVENYKVPKEQKSTEPLLTEKQLERLLKSDK